MKLQRQQTPHVMVRIGVVLSLLATVLLAGAPEAAAQATCQGKPVTVYIGSGQSPTSGDDVILGTAGKDNIQGGAGNDTICGLGGADTINGNSGNDVIDGGNGNDKLYGSWGNDIIKGGNGWDQIYGKAGSDTLNGQAGNDHLYGEDGADKIYGMGGDDVIHGGNGPDQIWGGWGADTIAGDGSNDILYGEGHNDTISGGYGNDTLNGGGGADTLDGNGGTDTANGAGGTDTCFAETRTSCELPQAPSWVAGSEVELDGVAPFWFTVSWCCHEGHAEYFEVTVINSQGVRDPYINTLPGHTWLDGRWRFEIDNFLGSALDSLETYTVEVVAIGPGGRSAVREVVAAVPEMFYEVVDSGGTNSVAQHSSAVESAEVCSWRGSAVRFGLRFFDEHSVYLGTHDASSRVCSTAGIITGNDVVGFHVCEADVADLFLGETPGQVIGSLGHAQVTNIFSCRLEGTIPVPTIIGVIPLTVDLTSVIEQHWVHQGGSLAVNVVPKLVS